MWLYFDSTGALVEALQHGNAARAGTTDFQIFAYFEGIDVIANGSATVKLVKPDLYDSSYPPLGMNKVNMKFKKLNGENSEHFSVNGGPNGDGTYPGFLFDFSNFSGDQDVAILLDTPGLWRAIISLYGQNHINVQGTATFNVQYGSIIDEGTELAWEEIVNSIFRIINTKLNIVNGIPVASSTESIDLTEYEVGQVFYIINAGKTTNKLVRVIENQSEEKDFETLFDFTAYYTKDEIDAKITLINDSITALENSKQDKLTTALETAQLQYVVGFDSQGKLRKGQGGGGAAYTAGSGIDITNFTISIDDTVVATKTFLSETYLSKSEASSTYETATHASATFATKTELETIKKNAFIKVNTTTYPTLASFLLSTGEEGYIYLYPIDTTDLTKGYYQYIWEDNAWLGIGTTRIDLSNYVDLDSAQTITGQKTILDKLTFKNSSPISDYQWYFMDNQFGDFELYRVNTRQLYFNCSGIIPNENKQKNLGQESRMWKEGFINKITDANGSYSSDNVFNVINASDIVNNTLTDAQIAIIQNGKPTRISGTFLELSNPILYTPNEATQSIRGFMIGQNGLRNFDFCSYSITKLSKVISKPYTYISLYNDTGLPIIAGKVLDYYRNNVYPYATNSTTELKYETINNITLSADTTYTLANAPANTYPEYKAKITNTDASNPITITLPSGTVIKAEPTIVVSSNTFVIPADTTVIVNIQDDLALVMLK